MENQQEPVPILHLPLSPLQTNLPSLSSGAENVSASATTGTGTAGEQGGSSDAPGTTIRLIEQKPRRSRSKWSEEETRDLIKGCGIHGVGNWKKYLSRGITLM
jgi:hypothetical protein